MTVYMEITQEKFELTFFVADTIHEMALKTGLKHNNISSQISKYKKGVYKKPRFICVEIENSASELIG